MLFNRTKIGHYDFKMPLSDTNRTFTFAYFRLLSVTFQKKENATNPHKQWICGLFSKVAS